MGKQKSMGQVLRDSYDDGHGDTRQWGKKDGVDTEPLKGWWERRAQAVIAEHERRKRPPCSDCQHVGSGSCKSCRYWMVKHAPSYFERKRAKVKKVKK